MKQIFLLGLMMSLVVGCAAYKRSWKWENYPGALNKYHCSEYAMAVVRDLRAKGIESYYVAYQWKTHDAFGPVTGKHAVAIFKSGETWKLVDNERVNPITVTGSTLLKMIQWREPFATAVIIDYFELPNIPVGVGAGNTEGFKKCQFK